MVKPKNSSLLALHLTACGPRPFCPCAPGDGEAERVLQRQRNSEAEAERELHWRGGARAPAATTRWSSAAGRYGDAWPRAATATATATRSTGCTDDKTELGASCTGEEVELDAEPVSAIASASAHERLPQRL